MASKMHEDEIATDVPLVRSLIAATRAAIRSLDDLNLLSADEAELAVAAWENALQASPWQREGKWVHGDLQAGNLLSRGGSLSAVIDFGTACVGDPACDTMPAWNLFGAETRKVFREALHVDDATWARGRGWALSCALIALPYYHETNPGLAGISGYAIREVLADYKRAA